MQAVILVGGQGTRLRPLTSTRPKPIVRLVDRPFMAYMLQWLASHQITDVVMLCGFLADSMVQEIGDGSAYGVNITWVQEPEPRGTAGALQVAAECLQEEFLMLNGDVLTDLDLSAQIRLHRESKAKATLALVPVEDPSAYGLVRVADDGTVKGFLEKPEPDQIDTDLISAGAYVLDRSLLSLIPAGRMVSIEREVWPKLVGNGLVGCIHRGAYWMDIGTPERYLQASADIQLGNIKTSPKPTSDQGSLSNSQSAAKIDEHSFIGAGSVIGCGSVVGSGSVVGKNVQIGANVVVDGAVILDNTVIADGARLRHCVVCEGATIGTDVHISELAMVGDGCVVKDNNTLAGGVKVRENSTIESGSLAFLPGCECHVLRLEELK